MFSGKDKAKLAAIARSQALIEFDRDGNILSANEIFLKLMGYAEREIIGKHHRIFVPDEERDTPEYGAFWDALRAGTFQAREFLRIARDGREVWIQASYNPILDSQGRTQSIMKVATDITAQKMAMAELNSVLNAIHRVQAVIEFDLDGNILVANENFLKTMGYRLDEVQRRHHSIFVTAEERASPAYRQFWADLRSGTYFAGEFCRRGKDNKEVWIQASYNPVFDARARSTRSSSLPATSRPRRRSGYGGSGAGRSMPSFAKSRKPSPPPASRRWARSPPPRRRPPASRPWPPPWRNCPAPSTRSPTRPPVPSSLRRKRPWKRSAPMMWWPDCPRRRRRSARWWSSSTRSPARPIFWPSTPPSRRHAPGRWARASPWWPRK